MFYELVATVAAGFGAGGLVLLLNRLTGRRLPRWVLPAAAGAAMLGFAIWSEYAWFTRTTAQLPDSVVVASHNEERSWYRPWSYLYPLTTRFVALDRAALRRNANFPGQIMGRVLLFGRWEPGVALNVVFDCAARRRVDLVEGVTLGEDGAPRGGTWRALPADDPLLRAACAQEG